MFRVLHNAGDLRTERLCDLHRKRPDASRRAVDQDPGPRSDPAHVAHGDHRGQARHDRCCSLFEGESGGLLDEPGGWTRRELCERAPCGERVGPRRSEHLVAGLEVGHVLADGLHDPGDIGPPHRGRRLPEPKAQAEEDVGDSSHRDPVRGVHAGGPHPNQNVVVADRWSVDLLRLEHPLRRPPYLSWTMAFIVGLIRYPDSVFDSVR